MKKLLRQIAVLLFGLALAACERSEFKAALASVSENALDSSKTQILMGSPTIADGVSPITVQVRCRNKKGLPIVGYQPKLAATGNGTTMVPCTVSNASGDSQCWIRSTVAETKMVSVAGLPSLEAPAVFMPTRSVQTLFGFVSFGDAQIAPTGHRFLTTAGTESRVEHKDLNNKFRVRSSHMGTAYGME